MILRLHTTARDSRRHRRIVENRGEVEALCFPVILPVVDSGINVEHIDTAHHFVHGAETQLCHVLPNLLCQKEKEIDNVFRLSLELLAQLRILRGDAHRAGIEMTLAHHDAADRNQRRRCETILFGAKEGGNHNISTGFRLPSVSTLMRLRRSLSSESLLCLRETQFPRHTRMFDGSQGRRAGAASMSADQQYIRARFCHAGCLSFRRQLRPRVLRDSRLRIDVFRVVNQLRKIFDRIDIVMWRWRDQADPGNRVPQPRDHFVDFVPRKLPAFAGLRTLRHLDLQFVSIHQIVCSHTKTRRGHLLDRAAPRVAVGVGRDSARGLPRPRPYSLLPPMRFIAIASVSCASLLIEP